MFLGTAPFGAVAILKNRQRTYAAELVALACGRIVLVMSLSAHDPERTSGPPSPFCRRLAGTARSSW
jgi:hypothetical protein